ncbi:ImmA/IrrE family metallo-endopeptidase [Paenibacillus thailandensis]|uniref:ImmA/IrrE family metallo-endopeptidase n=1 Tax=Paenibacillus thailandensis TaxID=393250 RepID=A0ABW5QSQ4_9BACL
MGIKKTVKQLIRKHGTNNPFVIASQKNIVVLFEPLGSIMGYFNTYKRIKMIHINNALSEEEQRFTCSHELGHAILHPKVNTPFLKRNTYFSIERIEREANEFAAELLIPDELLLEHSIRHIAALCGVPEEVSRLKRMPAEKSFWRDERSFFTF